MHDPLWMPCVLLSTPLQTCQTTIWTYYQSLCIASILLDVSKCTKVHIINLSIKYKTLTINLYDKKEKENCKMWLLFNMHFLPQCLFFFFFFFFENQTCGQRKDKEKEVLTIKRWWTGLLWERLWDWNLSNCWKFAGKFRGREERERGDKKREREDNFSKPMRINRITDEKALKPAFMWERMSESWKL